MSHAIGCPDLITVPFVVGTVSVVAAAAPIDTMYVRASWGSW